MPNKMLIDATHPEETRVVVVRGNRVEEFDFETAQRKQLRGNIYLAKVTRVEPSLQAAFIEYGGNRHGFLAFSEIHPDYYQIPVADRQALIEADGRAHREAEEENENRFNRRRPRHRNFRRSGNSERVQSEIVEDASLDPSQATQPYASHQEGPEYKESLHAENGHTQDSEHHNHDFHEQSHDHEHAYDEHDHVHTSNTPTAGTGSDTAAVGAFATTPEAFLDSESHEGHAHDEHPHETYETAVYGGEATSAKDIGDEYIEHAGGEPATPDDAEQAAAANGNENHDDEDDETEEEVVESVGGDDVLEEVPEHTFRPRRQYKIQEVIKRRQVMLVQVVKEERGNKGAALTTYLSLAGRYAVLMPNTARGGGISRKITSTQDRSRLKEVVEDLDVPEGMGIILRTAGASRTKLEIKRDFEYLIRMWETVRDMTLKSQAPTLVYEEGSLIKRSLRDLYNKEIDEILVAGESGYQEARDFMKMLMSSNVRTVKLYRDGQPLFSRMGVESQLDAMFSPTVQLRSGGYIVINQTEALVSIDVNSGRSTREHHIEDTALKTNLEAAEEVARQLRLRDLAGLIVIDFIDMDEKRNNRSVERKLSDCLRQDRARIQIGRISHFGLLEMSRQRIRASVLESSTEQCLQCGGSGHVRSVSSVALQLLRGLEELLMKGATHNLVVRTRTDVALYVLNHKRGHLRDLENSFKVTLAVIADPTVSGQPSFIIDRGEQVHTLEAAKALLAAQVASYPSLSEENFDEEDEPFDSESEPEVETDETEGLTSDSLIGQENSKETEGESHKRRRRRRRRGRSGETREGEPAHDNNDAARISSNTDTITEERESDEQPHMVRADQAHGSERRPRRRGRRGGRRQRSGMEDGLAGSIIDELKPTSAPEAASAVSDFDGNPPESSLRVVQTKSLASQIDQEVTRRASEAEISQEAERVAPRRRSTVREKVSLLTNIQPTETSSVSYGLAAEPPVASTAPAQSASEAPAQTQPRRPGWWSRHFGNRE